MCAGSHLGLATGPAIARSVGQAAQAATTLGEGSPLQSDETPVAEVDTLMAELRRAAARRHAPEHDLRASKDQLQVSKDRLQLALNAALLGWWRYDPNRRTGSGDARANEIHDFDIGEDEEMALEELLKRVHSDDVGRVEAAIDDGARPRRSEAVHACDTNCERLSSLDGATQPSVSAHLR
jgi:PAS domain-containing protein